MIDMKGLRSWILAAAVALTMPFVTFAANAPQNSSGSDSYLARQVRHELVMLPYYSIFDDLGYTVQDRTVTLYGHVVRPVLKSDAQNVVKRIEGVENVVNNIQVLPLSSFDDSIRVHAARAIYGYGALQRYGMGTQPSIHIIVNNGNVTLTGVVDNNMDKNLAYIRANQVFGVFSVKNDLIVANGRA
jgi:hyperosmotically inducible periplasmic protein